jgi:hypothetical protein
MKIEDLKTLYQGKGDFKFPFQWYLPVSVKFSIADMAVKQKVSENKLVEKYLKVGLEADGKRG